MSFSNNIEEYLRVCSKGDMKSLERLFINMNAKEIESIRDTHKAR